VTTADLVDVLKLVGAILGVLTPPVLALWAWMQTVQKRADDKVTAANLERDKWAARWAREVELGVQRACEKPPQKLPTTLPPPAFTEPEEVRAKREELERKRLERIRKGADDAELDRTLTKWLDEMKSIPPPKP
jgi:hypothetical protein